MNRLYEKLLDKNYTTGEAFYFIFFVNGLTCSESYYFNERYLQTIERLIIEIDFMPYKR